MYFSHILTIIPNAMTFFLKLIFVKFSKIFLTEQLNPLTEIDICFKLAHDVVYVNYYFYIRNRSKNKYCHFCKNIETVQHLFLECSFFKPLNEIVTFMIQLLSEKKT